MREAEKVDEAGSGNDALVVDAPVDAGELLDERELARGPRGEVGVAAFRGRREEAAVDVVEQRFAEPGAGGNQRGVPRRHGDAFLQHRQLVGLEHGHGVRHRLEIVQQRGRPPAEASATTERSATTGRSSAARPGR